MNKQRIALLDANRRKRGKNLRPANYWVVASVALLWRHWRKRDKRLTNADLQRARSRERPQPYARTRRNRERKQRRVGDNAPYHVWYLVRFLEPFLGKVAYEAQCPSRRERVNLRRAKRSLWLENDNGSSRILSCEKLRL